MFVEICALATLVIPALLLAQTDYVPLAPLPNITDLGKTTTSLPTYLTGIYKLGIGAAGVLAVLMLVWGGFQYMTTEAVSGKSESKGVIMNVVWGLATVLASYVLLYTINPRLVDIGLAIGKLNPVTKTRIQSVEDTYGKFLDEALQRAQNISTKAKDLKIAGDAVDVRVKELDRKFREGDFTPEEIANLSALEEELDTLRPKLQEIKTKETVVRSYEGAVDWLSTDMRAQINKCLKGGGTCLVPTGLLDRLNPTNWTWQGGLPRVDYNIANKDVGANNAAVSQMLLAARAKVEKDAEKLETAGLNDRAIDLRQRMTNIETETAFYIRCPNSKTLYVKGRGLESGNCPP